MNWGLQQSAWDFGSRRCENHQIIKASAEQDVLIIISQQLGLDIDMADKKEEGEGVWRFPKLKGADNIIQWERNMITVMKSAYLYGWIDGSKILPPEVPLVTMKAEDWIRTDIREYQREIEDYNFKNIALRGRIKRMCNEHVVQSIDTEGKTVKEIWSTILTRYKPQRWSKKWAMMNRFEELNYIDKKSIEALASKIIVIKSE